METVRRNSRQRNRLRELLKDRRDHPDAQTVYMEMRKSFPSVSLGTVYRNLMLLTEEHELQSINVGDGRIHFDPNIAPHAHFYCKKCGRVLDLMTYDRTYELIKDQIEDFDGKLDECSLSFKGICADCLHSK